jgi:membrane protease subunit HflK
MFDRLLELLIGWWDTLKVFEVLMPYEKGVRVRWGQYHSEVGPGVVWKWSLADDILRDNVVPTTTPLHEQTLTTADGVTCVVRGIVRWRINNVRRLLLEVEDADGAIIDVCHGAITDNVINNDWDYICSDTFMADVAVACRLDAWKYGVEIQDVKFVDMVKLRAYRLIGER